MTISDEDNSDSTLSTDSYDIPRYAINSPFAREYKSPIAKKAKQLWADSFLWEKAPELVVEKWLNGRPEIDDRYLLVEFWATWCAPCKRTIPFLNHLHRTFEDELSIIAISDEAEEIVTAYDGPGIEYFSAIDTKARMKDALGVVGIPHIIIVEPGGSVVWEGFPLLPNYELTEEMVASILEVGRKQNLTAKRGSN